MGNEELEQFVGPKYITVVYRINDEELWRKTNPLKYEHNGLKAVRVSVGDVTVQFDKLGSLCLENGIDVPDEIYGA